MKKFISFFSLAFVVLSCTSTDGIDGIDGYNSLIVILSDDNAVCPNEGIVVHSGLDLNRNNILETSEYTVTNYVCNGIDGTNGLDSKFMVTTDTSVDATNSCGVYADGSNIGGVEITYGYDLNNNGVLDEGEISFNNIICNGSDGYNGIDGNSVLVSIYSIEEGDSCVYGGISINYGLDVNRNEILDDEEVQGTNFICNKSLVQGTYNNVTYNSDKIYSFKQIYENKITDVYNCVNVFFNGDSILGAQLDDNSDSNEALSGDFPQNMRKNIIARKFLDEYQYDTSDVVYRNLSHNDWTHSLATLNDGVFFNHQQNYSIAEGGFAEISVIDYSFLKLCFSGSSSLDYSFQVSVSVNGGSYFKPSSLGLGADILQPTQGQSIPSEYEMYKLDKTKKYDFKIEPKTGFENGLFFGCEMWNNERLNVVVNAYSGSTALQTVEDRLNGWYSEKYIPRLIISNMFVINDQSYINAVESYTYDSFIRSSNQVYNYAKDNNIPCLLINPHYVYSTENYNTYAIARGLAISRGEAFVDIRRMQEELKIPESDFVGADGLHLKDEGVQKYFEQIKKVVDLN